MDPRIGRSRIPEWLARRDKRQVDLAKHLKVSEPYLSQVISGRGQLSVVKMKKTANFLDCYMDELVEWEYE